MLYIYAQINVIITNRKGRYFFIHTSNWREFKALLISSIEYCLKIGYICLKWSRSFNTLFRQNCNTWFFQSIHPKKGLYFENTTTTNKKCLRLRIQGIQGKNNLVIPIFSINDYDTYNSGIFSFGNSCPFFAQKAYFYSDWTIPF